MQFVEEETEVQSGQEMVEPGCGLMWPDLRAYMINDWSQFQMVVSTLLLFSQSWYCADSSLEKNLLWKS